jgi:uncharacterized protein DUF6159
VLARVQDAPYTVGMNRFQRSWEIAKASFGLLEQHRNLLLFPLVSGICTVFIAIFFLSPLFFLQSNQGLGLAAMAGLYVASMFVATFFNVAFVHAIFNAFKGGEVSISESLSFAMTKLPAIFMWSLMAGLVGLVIRRLEEKLGLIGRLMVGLIGVAWSIAATFAIPAIVVTNDANPLDALKLSAQTIKKTWGEGIIAFVGFDLLNAAIFGLSLPILLVSIWGFVAGFMWVGVMAAAAWVLVLLSLSYVLNVAVQIFRGALFLYAYEGLVAGGFTQEELHAAGTVRAS